MKELIILISFVLNCIFTGIIRAQNDIIKREREKDFYGNKK